MLSLEDYLCKDRQPIRTLLKKTLKAPVRKMLEYKKHAWRSFCSFHTTMLSNLFFFSTCWVRLADRVHFISLSWLHIILKWGYDVETNILWWLCVVFLKELTNALQHCILHFNILLFVHRCNLEKSLCCFCHIWYVHLFRGTNMGYLIWGWLAMIKTD